LNRRPSGYEPDELPGCSTPRPMEANYTPHEISRNPLFGFIQINHLVADFLGINSSIAPQFGRGHFFRLLQFLSDRPFVIVSPVNSHESKRARQ